MAVAYDAYADTVYASGLTASNTGLTPGASATALLAIWIGASVPTGLSITWNSVTMTQIGSFVNTTDGAVIGLYGLVNPATGNHTLAASWTSPSTYGYLTGVSFTGTATSSVANAFKNFNSNVVTTASTSGTVTITGATGNISVGVGANNGSGTAANSISATSSTTLLVTNSNQAYGAGYAPSASSVTWTFTLSVASTMALAGVDVAAPSAALPLPFFPSYPIQLWDH